MMQTPPRRLPLPLAVAAGWALLTFTGLESLGLDLPGSHWVGMLATMAVGVAVSLRSPLGRPRRDPRDGWGSGRNKGRPRIDHRCPGERIVETAVGSLDAKGHDDVRDARFPRAAYRTLVQCRRTDTCITDTGAAQVAATSARGLSAHRRPQTFATPEKVLLPPPRGSTAGTRPSLPRTPHSAGR